MVCLEDGSPETKHEKTSSLQGSSGEEFPRVIAEIASKVDASEIWKNQVRLIVVPII